MRRLLLCFSCLLFSLVSASARAGQEKTGAVVLGESAHIYSKALQEQREIWIYLPDEYRTSGDTYPVVYLMDGSNHFKHVSGLAHFYSQRGAWPQLLVVAVLNKSQETRSRDFSPVRVESRPNSGGALNFRKFLKDELIPWVENQYRTQPYRILVGHSLAGLFAVHTLLTEPELFDAYIATSPWLGYFNNHVITEAEKRLSQRTELHKFLYMTAGDEPRLVTSIQAFIQVLEKYPPAGLNWSYIQLPEEDHGTVPHQGMLDGFRKLYAPWRMPAEVYQIGIEAVLGHYRILSDLYGYPLEPSFVDLYFLGIWFLQRRQAVKAVGVLEQAVKLYPQNWAGYSSLGEAYLLKEEVESAIRSYQKAVELNPEFIRGKEILERLKKKYPYASSIM